MNLLNPLSVALTLDRYPILLIWSVCFVHEITSASKIHFTVFKTLKTSFHTTFFLWFRTIGIKESEKSFEGAP